MLTNIFSNFTMLFTLLILARESHCIEPVIREGKAEGAHAIGLEYAMKGEYEPAAAHFRTACRLQPNDVKYLNDLGVTEMRMEQHGLALQRLAAASRIDPTYEYTQKNLAELRKIVSEDEYNRAMSADSTVRPQVSAVHPGLQRRYSYAGSDELYTDLSGIPSIDDLKYLYLANDEGGQVKRLLSKPFVIRKAAQKWGWNLKHITARLLENNFGTMRADFYPHNMRMESATPRMTSLSQALRQLELPDMVFYDVDVYSGGATYIQWNIDEASWVELLSLLNASIPTLLDDRFWFKKCFPDIHDRNSFSHKTHWRMVLIGNEKAGMFNHRDTLSTASWQMQLKGKKKWHICSTNQENFLYRPGDVDCFEPNYEQYPNMINASCYQTTVTPGDFIYYPRDYWHQTQNLSPLTVSITDTMIGHDSHEDLSTQLANECAGQSNKGRMIFKPDTSMCAALDQCYHIWRDIYNSNQFVSSTDQRMRYSGGNNEF